ncbi:hypothetical protein Lesp02_56860 [Lentzea sp. NBRC 105346]|uniref:hypothetical protein n=1 Tax=Lentzea sp. NBRC 105346 TaxID=3032205 RepID=UPI0024A1A212|nr:hypothetical protein [Lentzea sp. NBRC 105346]GLZ33498.1 hypothetical protein Lesp02_56860 [Lentzea sp. NBRC 105346]
MTQQLEYEEFLGNVLGEGEDELEAEEELEGEYESEFEEELEALVGQHEYELEDEARHHEYEDEARYHEYEDEGEEFFKRIGRGLRRFGRIASRGLKVLRPLAKIAAPMIGTALGGPLGGLAGKAIGSLLESEYEDEAEFEEELARPISATHAQAEALAASAAHAESEGEAEALVGAAASTLLSRPDRRALRKVHADLVRGASVLAELLHRNKATRAYTGIVPSIVDRTANTLTKYARSGRPLNSQVVGHALGAHATRVLADPQAARQALTRHVRGVRKARQLGMVATYPGPLRAPVVNGSASKRPGRSTVQVTTPVRVPTANGSRLVRVVSHVKVPEGAVPAGRTASVRQDNEF